MHWQPDATTPSVLPPLHPKLPDGTPRKCPADGSGASPPGHPPAAGRPGPDFCTNPCRLDRMSTGQTGHFHRTKATHPQDGCYPKVEVSRQISLCLLVKQCLTGGCNS